MHRSTAPQNYKDTPRLNKTRPGCTGRLREKEIDSETYQNLSFLEVPAINWAQCVGEKHVYYAKMGQTPGVAAEEDKNWDLERTVRDSEQDGKDV